LTISSGKINRNSYPTRRWHGIGFDYVIELLHWDHYPPVSNR